MAQELLDKRDTDFVRDNMLINYCLGDNDELLIDSFFQNNQVDIRFNPKHYYFLITGIHNKYVSKYTKETFSSGVSSVLNTYTETQSLLARHGYNGNAFLIKEDNSKQFGLLFSPENNSDCTPLHIAEELNALYHLKNPLKSEYISTSLVGPYCGYEQAHSAFIKARELNDLLFFGLKKRVITETFCRETAKPCDITAILSNVRALNYTLCCGTLKKALEQFNYLTDNLVAPSYSMINFHALCVAVDDLFGMLEIVYPDQIRIRRIASTEFFSLEEYRQYGETMLRLIYSQLQGVRRYSPTILLALSYINRCYTQQLSLSQLSEYVYTNPSSLSSEFSCEVGVTLSEYLCALRIAHAKRLLKSTELPIPDIAQQSGFTNAKYFRELFKKQTGISPQQYRECVEN